MASDSNIIFIGIVFYPLVDLLFSVFVRYWGKAKKRFEFDYYMKILLVAGGWIVIAFVGLMIVACWKRYWYFVDFDAFLDDRENETTFAAYHFIFIAPVAVWIVYETGIFDDLIDLARTSPMEFSILFSSGPILITSGAFKIVLSPIFFGLDWIVYFVCVLVYIFYLMVGATAADQDYERDDDERDELELDVMGEFGSCWIEGLDGMIMNIEGDKYTFLSVSDDGRRCGSRRMIRLDQIPRWILDDLTKEIMFHIVTELVGDYTFNWFFYYPSPSPYSPRLITRDAEASLIRLIEEYSVLNEEMEYLPLDHPLVEAVEYGRKIAVRSSQVPKKNGVFHWLKKLWRRRFLQE